MDGELHEGEGIYMATILVDYENVYPTNGLKGVEYLTRKDSIYIFYSQCCCKVKAEYMENIEKSECDFHINKLEKTGKNALDFYIASECGIIFQKGETQIVIISNDKGFGAVVDFFKKKGEVQDVMVVTAPNVECGIMQLNAADDAERRMRLHQKVKMLDLGQEYARLEERKVFKQKMKTLLLGTEYECMTDQVVEFMEESMLMPKKEVYTGALHNFGQMKGRAIYRLIKDIV